MSEARPRQGARKVTFSIKRSSKRQLAVMRAENPYPDDVQRPRTRADCLPGGCNGERPCPFAACRHHLSLDVLPNGSVTINFPDVELGQLADTCALDAADRGGLTLEDVGERMNLTRERVRQLEHRALYTLPDDAVIALQAHR